MTTWSKNGKKMSNKSEVYREFLNKTGADKVDHYGVIFFGDPREDDFLEGKEKIDHIYSTGDSLSKIAFKHYGDARLWWLLAWYNSKPTDFHCKLGDIIEVPFPLREVLEQAYDSRV